MVSVHDVIAEAVPDREMVVCGDVRRTYGEVADRSRGLAAHFLVPRARRASASAASSSAGSAARTPSPWCSTTAPSTSRRCSAPTGRGRCRSTSTSTTARPRWPACSPTSTCRPSSTTAPTARWSTAACDTAAVVLIEVDDGSGVEPAPRQHRLRGRRRHARRGAPARSLPRRPLHGVHRGHHRPTEGGALAPGGHLHLGDGWGRGRDRRVDRGGRRAGWRSVVRHAAAHARCRPVDGVRRPPPGRDGGRCTTTASAFDAAGILTTAERERCG